MKTLVSTILVSFVVGFLGALFGLSVYMDVYDLPMKLAGEGDREFTAQSDHEQSVINVVNEVSGGVVSVIATKDVPIYEQYYRSPFGDLFPGLRIPSQRQRGTETRQISAGTGFVVSEDGLIMTNKHVVSDEEADYTIITNDGEKIPADVLARDPLQDLAVLKVNKSLPALKLADLETLQPGQTVIAIGNALGEFQNTVSVGVISGLRRTIIASSGAGESEQLDEVIQTDAAVNPGNSGGPLLNLSGEVVGVNVAVASGAENIGFAIPVNRAIKALNDVKTRGKITYPYIGVRYVLVDEEVQKQNNLKVDYGALVLKGSEEEPAVLPGSPADKAGIVENDIILEINGNKITRENSLAKIIQSLAVGEVVNVKILRGGEEKNMQVTLEERK